MAYAKKQNLKYSPKLQLAVSFMHLRLRRELRNITGRWEKAG